MPDQSNQLTLEELEDLVGGVALRFNEVSAVRLKEDEGAEAFQVGVNASLMGKDKGDRISVRMRVEIDRPEAKLVVDCAAQFRWENEDRPAVFGEVSDGKPSAVGQRFIELVSLPYLVSYIRPVLDQQARTLEIPVLTLPLDYFRGAELEFGDDDTDPEDLAAAIG